jgi:TonB-dependent starch-binding outer membrane protein SusC
VRHKAGILSAQEEWPLANVANPDLKWETTETVNAGVDFAFLNNRFSGTVEVFHRETNDLLFQLPTIQPAPNAQYWTNIDASIINKGAEVSLNAVVLNQKSLHWDLGVNATFLKNRFTNYSGAPILTGRISGSGLGGGIPVQLLTKDQPLFVYRLRDYLGLDHDGVALYSTEATYKGNPNPNFLLGINTSLAYESFDFNANLNGAFGHKLYNNTSLVNLSPSTLAISRNASDEVGLSNESLNNAVVLSDRFLENGNYLRLSNATLGYTFGNLGSKIKNLRLYLTGQNIFVITKYTGFDPEVNTDKQTNGVPSFGIDYQSYPLPRTIIFGLNVSL